MHTCTHILIPHINKYTNIYGHHNTDIHICNIITYKHTHTYEDLCHTYTYINTYMNTHIDTYIYATHIDIHTYHILFTHTTHTYTHIQSLIYIF